MIVESVDDVIKLSGELTKNQWEAIRTAAGLVLKKHPQGVVVDCGGLEKITPEGAETFYDMMKHIQAKKARIIVANVPAEVRASLKGVEEVRSGLAVADTVEDARQSLELLDTIAKPNGRKAHTTGTLVLSLCSGPADSYALALAAAIAERRHLRVVAVYSIVVPRALPTGTVMPEEEDAAAEALQTAQSFLDSKGIHVQPVVERTRSAASAIAKVADEHDARSVIVALPRADAEQGEPAKTVEGVLSKVSSEVVLVREPVKR